MATACLICSGMAQAADTPHQVQGKRSRMYLGLAGAERDAHLMTREYEEQVFRAALQDAAWNARLSPVDPTATARVASPHRVFA